MNVKDPETGSKATAMNLVKGRGKAKAAKYALERRQEVTHKSLKQYWTFVLKYVEAL